MEDEGEEVAHLGKLWLSAAHLDPAPGSTGLPTQMRRPPTQRRAAGESPAEPPAELGVAQAFLDQRHWGLCRDYEWLLTLSEEQAAADPSMSCSEASLRKWRRRTAMSRPSLPASSAAAPSSAELARVSAAAEAQSARARAQARQVDKLLEALSAVHSAVTQASAETAALQTSTTQTSEHVVAILEAERSALHLRCRALEDQAKQRGITV